MLGVSLVGSSEADIRVARHQALAYQLHAVTHAFAFRMHPVPVSAMGVGLTEDSDDDAGPVALKLGPTRLSKAKTFENRESFRKRRSVTVLDRPVPQKKPPSRDVTFLLLELLFLHRHLLNVLATAGAWFCVWMSERVVPFVLMRSLAAPKYMRDVKGVATSLSPALQDELAAGYLWRGRSAKSSRREDGGGGAGCLSQLVAGGCAGFKGSFGSGEGEGKDGGSGGGVDSEGQLFESPVADALSEVVPMLHVTVSG